MRLHNAFGKLVALFILVIAGISFANGAALGTNCLVSFATVDEARAVLTNRDDFMASLSGFDRAARMKTNRAVTEQEFLKFVGKSALSWLSEETNQVASSIEVIRQRLEPWHLPFPATILLIKSSGVEEGDASYTRGNSVIIPRNELQNSGAGLESLITHELFHILSRHNPELRRKLYQIVGFTRINDIEYPGELRSRKITNPDGFQSGWAIQITNQNRSVPAVQVLYSSMPNYDPHKGGEFFDYLTFKLLVVTNQGDRWQPALADGKPRLIEPQDAQGFFEQVGSNTGYIIHPDEILADNFVLMVKGTTNLATPRIVSDMQKALNGGL